MSAGTITIKNNTAAVVGDGTAFTTELAAGDFIVIKAGGVTYTLPVKSVESDTALTLSRPYAGPAASGSAWTAMPRDTLNSISAQIAADTSYAIRQRVLEIDNWYQLLEVNGEVTINMADGSSYTGPSWLRLIDLMNALDIDQLTPLADQIRADAAQVAEDKPVIVQAKDDAEAAAVAAAASQKAAASSEAASASSETAAADSATSAAKSAQEAASHNPVEALVKTSNLSDLEDREEAWLNVRPEGPTPLVADPVDDLDATTKKWVEALRTILTSWTVLKIDAAAPANGTQAAGGKIGSRYSIAGVDQFEGQMWAEKTIGEAESRLVFSAANTALNVRNWMSFSTAGNLTITGEYRGATAALTGLSYARTFQASGVGYDPGIFKTQSAASADDYGVNCIYGVAGLGSSTYCYQYRQPNQSYQHVWRLDHDGQNKYFSIRSDNNMYTPVGAVAIQGCDVRIKNGFEPPKAGAWERIEAIGICEFMYNGSTIPQRGPLAQQMADIDPVYVFEGGTATDENGKDFEILNVNEKAVMADMITVIQELQARVKELEARLK